MTYRKSEIRIESKFGSLRSWFFFAWSDYFLNLFISYIRLRHIHGNKLVDTQLSL